MAWLSKLLTADRITRAVARDALEAFFAEGTAPQDFIQQNGLLLQKNDALLQQAITDVLAANPGAAAEYRSGKEKVFAFLVGQVMKQLKGKASPKDVSRLLQEALAK